MIDEFDKRRIDKIEDKEELRDLYKSEKEVARNYKNEIEDFETMKENEMQFNPIDKNEIEAINFKIEKLQVGVNQQIEILVYIEKVAKTLKVDTKPKPKNRMK